MVVTIWGLAKANFVKSVATVEALYWKVNMAIIMSAINSITFYLQFLVNNEYLWLTLKLHLQVNTMCAVTFAVGYFERMQQILLVTCRKSQKGSTVEIQTLQIYIWYMCCSNLLYLKFTMSFWCFWRTTQVLPHQDKQIQEKFGCSIWQFLQISLTSTSWIWRTEPGTEIFLKSVSIEGPCSLLNLGCCCIWRKWSNKREMSLHITCTVCILEGSWKCVKELPFHYYSCRQLNIKDSNTMKGLFST